MADPLAPDRTATIDDGPSSPEYAPPEDQDEVLDDLDDDQGLDPRKIDAEEELEPRVEHVPRLIQDARGRGETYVQKPLTYFGKMELYGLLGRAVGILLRDEEGQRGLGLNQILDMVDPRNMIDKMMAQIPGADTSPDRAENEVNVEEAARMMASFARVISVAPEMLQEAYCIILNIPKGHRKWAMDWGLPELDDETGTDVMHVFIDQNWGVMEDFFAQELPKLFRRAATARKRHKSAGVR